jgi:pyrroloquinoline quinone (PQQ) biosynthesis protein C
MHTKIKNYIYSATFNSDAASERELLIYIDVLCKKAFIDNDEEALLDAHRILYVINSAYLANPWQETPHNLMHPTIMSIKSSLEISLEQARRRKYNNIVNEMPSISNFPHWIKHVVGKHRSNQLHPIFIFLRDKATLEQMREYFFQESPLEMIFGDILAFMLPGVYGDIKIEFLKNYWDEVGHAKDEKVHRNLRANLMNHLDIKKDCYTSQFELFLREELELANLYLSLATNRAKHTQLVGVMLATELMVPNRFQYSIDGWRRLGVEDKVLTYLIEHISTDEVHAEDWLEHVVIPILQKIPESGIDIMLGILNRLDVAVSVLDKLYEKLQQTHISSVGVFKGSFHGK